METPFGTIEPLGFERFKICELVAELLHCSNMGLLGEPTGEAIVHERDVKRDEIIAALDEQIPGVGTVDALGNDINNLKISTRSEESLDDDDDDDDQIDTEGSSPNRTDIHSESSSDSEATEKTLRENPVVGDLLKISLQDNNVISTILNMFFRFPWNNFLHNVVFDIVQQIFNGPLKNGYNKFLLADLFSSAHITDVIMEGDKKCLDYEKETGVRLGYMGHLTLIAEEVAKFAAYVEEANVTFSSPIVQKGLNEPKWKEYCDTILTETREKYSSLLGEDGIDEDENEEPEDEIFEEDDAINENGERFLDVNGSLHYTDEDDDERVAALGEDNCFVYEDAMGNKTKIQVRPDEEEEDSYDQNYNQDLNKFSNYMSNQLSKGLPLGDNDVDDEERADEEEEIWNGQTTNTFQPQIPNKTFFNNSMFHSHQFDLSPDDEEDYLDPNDDGQSYAKPNHPLYSSMLSSGSIPYETGDDELNDLEVNEDDDIASSPNEYSLRRTSSNDTAQYSSVDQNRISGLPSLQRSSSHDTE